MLLRLFRSVEAYATGVVWLGRFTNKAELWTARRLRRVVETEVRLHGTMAIEEPEAGNAKRILSLPGGLAWDWALLLSLQKQMTEDGFCSNVCFFAALGLGAQHSSSPADVMWPYYRPQNSSDMFSLHFHWIPSGTFWKNTILFIIVSSFNKSFNRIERTK